MLYVECYPETTLAKMLGIPRKKITHASGKGDVCKKLSKNRNSKGLIDEDPYSTQPNYLKRLELLAEENDVKLLIDNKNRNQTVVICPKLEDWIITATKEVGTDLRDFGLPNDPYELHKIIHLRLDKFERLLKALIGKSRRLNTLKNS